VSRGRGDVERIASLAGENKIIEVIVGLPTGLSGNAGLAAAGARRFAAALARRLAPVPVRLLDERFTTVIAHESLRRAGKDSRQRRSIVDRTAAALLLQDALDAERSTGRPAGVAVGVTPGGGT
jgi:putative Holliday junction resolvase